MLNPSTSDHERKKRKMDVKKEREKIKTQNKNLLSGLLSVWNVLWSAPLWYMFAVDLCPGFQPEQGAEETTEAHRPGQRADERKNKRKKTKPTTEKQNKTRNKEMTKTKNLLSGHSLAPFPDFCWKPGRRSEQTYIRGAEQRI